MKIKIIKCRNKFFWYRTEAKKKMKDKAKFKTEKCEDECNDKKGLIVPGKGFVFHRDYKIVK